MSKKETPVDDDLDFNFDDNYDFDDISNDRKSESGVIKKSLSQVANEVVSPDSVSKLLDNALPSEFGEVKSKTGEVVDELAKSYRAAVDDVKPSVNELARAVDRLVPSNIPFIKDKLKRVIDSTSKEVDDNGQSAAKIREQSIQSELANVFTNINFSANAVKEEAKEVSKEQIKEQVSLTQGATTNRGIGNIETVLTNSFNLAQHINATYHRKSLELQFRSYYVMADLLESSKVFYEASRVQNEAIIKNTGLPEFVKLNESERFSELARNKLYGTFQESLFGNGDYIRGVGEKLKRKTLEFTGGIKEKLEQGVMAADGIGQLKDIAEATGEEFSFKETAREHGVSAAVGYGVGRAGKRLGRYLDDNFPVVGNKIKQAKNMFDFAQIEGEKIGQTDFSELASLETNPVKKLFYSFMEEVKDVFSTDRSRPRVKLDSVTENPYGASVFDNIVRRSIVEVIPKYLSSIQNELSNIYSANQNWYGFAGANMPRTFTVHGGKFEKFTPHSRNTERLHFDPITGNLSKVKDISRNLELKLINDSAGKQRVRVANDAVAELISKNAIDEKEIKQIAIERSVIEHERETLETLNKTASTEDKKQIRNRLRVLKRAAFANDSKLREASNKKVELDDELTLKLNRYVIDSATSTDAYKKDPSNLSSAKYLRDFDFTEQEIEVVQPLLKIKTDDNKQRALIAQRFEQIRENTKDASALIQQYGTYGSLRDIKDVSQFLDSDEDENEFSLKLDSLNSSSVSLYSNTAEQTVASARATGLTNSQKVYSVASEDDEKAIDERTTKLEKTIQKRKDNLSKLISKRDELNKEIKAGRITDTSERDQLTKDINTASKELARDEQKLKTLKTRGSLNNNQAFRRSVLKDITEPLIVENNKISGKETFKPIPNNILDVENHIAEYEKEYKEAKKATAKASRNLNTKSRIEKHKELEEVERSLKTHLDALYSKRKELNKGQDIGTSDENAKSDIIGTQDTKKRIGLLDRLKALPVYSWKYKTKAKDSTNANLVQEDNEATADSDVNLKGEITKPKGFIGSILDKFRTTSNNKDKTTFIGPMAQDTNKLLGEEAAPGGKSINLVTMNGVLTSAVQKLAEEVDSLKAQIGTGIEKSKTVATNSETAKVVKAKVDQTSETAKSKFKQAVVSVKSLKDESRLAENIYLPEGRNKRLIISNEEFSSGTYVTDSNKPVRTILDITEDIFSVSGELIIDYKEDYKKLVFADNVPVIAASKVLAVKSYINDSVKEIKQRAKHITQRYKDHLDVNRDIYVKGETTPRMLNFLIQSGDYYLNDDGSAIKEASDISGKVRNNLGEVLLTLEDLKTGIYYGIGVNAVKVKYANALVETLKKYQESKTLANEGIAKASELRDKVTSSKTATSISGMFSKGSGFIQKLSDVFDLYVRKDEGFDLVIEAKKIRKGLYVTADNKPVKRVADIDNVVYEKVGNEKFSTYEVVLSESDIVHGVYSFINGEYELVEDIGTKKDGKHHSFIKGAVKNLPGMVKGNGLFKSYLDYQLNDKESTYSRLTDILAGSGSVSEKSRAIERLILSKALFKGPMLAGKAAVKAIQATMNLAGKAMSPILSPITSKLSEAKGMMKTGISLHRAKTMDTEELRAFILDLTEKVSAGDLILPKRYLADLEKILVLKENSERGTGNNFISKAIIKAGDFLKDRLSEDKDDNVYSKDKTVNIKIKKLISETKRKTASEVKELKAVIAKELEEDETLDINKELLFKTLDEIIEKKRKTSKPTMLKEGLVRTAKGLGGLLASPLLAVGAIAKGSINLAKNIKKDFKDASVTGVAIADLKELNDNQLVKLYKDHKDEVSEDYVKEIVSLLEKRDKRNNSVIGKTLGLFSKKKQKDNDSISEVIAQSVVSKLAPEKASFNDKDGDGDRDNNANDRLESINSKKDRLGVRAKEDKKEESEESGWLSKIFGVIAGGVIGLLGSIWDGIKKIPDLIKAKTIADAASNLPDSADSKDKDSKDTKKTSKKGRVIEGVKKTGRVVGRVALGAVRALSLFNPVTLAATAAIGIGYYAYKAYTSINNKNITKYRMAQYGLTEKDTDKYDAVLSLEEHLFDKLTPTDKGLKVNYSKLDQEKIADWFGIDRGGMFSDVDQEHTDKFEAWFKDRFVPVFLVHMDAIRSLNVKNKTGVIIPSFKDYNTHTVHQLADIEKSRYLSLTLFQSGPYSKTISPFKDLDVLKAGLSDVVKLHDSAKKEVKDVKVPINSRLPDTNPTSDPKTMAEYQKQKDDALRKQLEERTKESMKSLENKPVSNKTPMLGETDPSKTEQVKKEEVSNTSANPNGIPMASGGLENPDEGAVKAVGSADVNNLNSAFKDKVFGMASEFQKLTGDPLVINSGFRSYEKQAALHKANPAKAAPPGRSLHEFGLAVDINSQTFNKLEELGLTRKYGITRPVGGEPWHGEPAGIQLNLNGSKEDPQLAAQLVESGVFKGGGGFGSIEGTPLGKRDPFMAAKTMNESISKKLEAKVEQVDAAKANAVLAQTEQSKVDTSKPAYTTNQRKVQEEQLKQSIYTTNNKNSVSGQLTKTAASDTETNPTSGSANVNNVGVNASKDDVKKVIEDAAKAVGVDPKLMLTVAQVESGLNPNASAGTSSAKGLFQFINSTWNETVSKYGKRHGIVNGTSPLDPKANALMAAEYIKNNLNSLKGLVNDPGALEAYLAHFLGINGARAVLKADNATPASDVLPDAAKSNYNIFYSNGRPRTVGQVEETIGKKLETAAKVVGVNLDINKPTNSSDSGNTSSTVSTDTASTQSTPATSTTPTNTTSTNSGFIKTPQSASLTSTAPVAPSYTTDKPVQAVKDTNTELMNTVAATNVILKESLTTQKGMLEQLIKIATNGVNSSSPTSKEESAVKTQKVSEDRSLTRHQAKARTNTAVNLQRPIN